MKESILPRMHTATQDTVLGGIIKHVNDRKMVIVLGESGKAKPSLFLIFVHKAHLHHTIKNVQLTRL